MKTPLSGAQTFRPICGLLVITCIVSAVASPAEALTLRVPQDHATVSAAIAAASSGDTIRVAAGTYSLATNGETFPLVVNKSGLQLIGEGAAISSLDAGGAASVILWSAASGGRVTGFTLTGGRAALGGGLQMLAGDAQFDHLRFMHNGASVGGGAISTHGTASPWIHHNVIVDSYSTSGLDVHALRLNGKSGGLFEHNLVAHSDGNGLLTVDSVTTQVRNNIFYQNGIPSPPRGRGICWISDLPAHVHHNLFFQNQVAAMFWSSGGGDYDALTANAYSPNDDVYANLESDPGFIDATGGDYHLLGSSPAIDAGDPAAPPDADGTPADIGPFARIIVTAVTPPTRDVVLSLAPNPARNGTVIRFTLAQRGTAYVHVVDAAGRRVRTLVDHELLGPGPQELRWDGADASGQPASPGLYWVQVRCSDRLMTKRLAIVR